MIADHRVAFFAMVDPFLCSVAGSWCLSRVCPRSLARSQGLANFPPERVAAVATRALGSCHDTPMFKILISYAVAKNSSPDEQVGWSGSGGWSLPGTLSKRQDGRRRRRFVYISALLIVDRTAVLFAVCGVARSFVGVL